MLANRDIYNLGDIIEIRLTYLNWVLWKMPD
jgi:hypothetical protein